MCLSDNDTELTGMAVLRSSRGRQIYLHYIGPANRELSPNFGDGPEQSGGGDFGLTVGRLGNDLDPIVECHT
jgi:hypothetical protein